MLLHLVVLSSTNKLISNTHEYFLLISLFIIFVKYIKYKFSVSSIETSCLNYLLHFVKVDETSAYLTYKNFDRMQNESEDECLRLGCYQYELNGVVVFCKTKCF